MNYTNTLKTFKNEYPVSIDAQDDREMFQKLDQVFKWIQFEDRSRSSRPEYLLFCADGSESCPEFEWVGKIFSPEDAELLYEEYMEHTEVLRAKKAKNRSAKRIIFFPLYAQARSIKSTLSDLKYIYVTFLDSVKYSKSQFMNAKEKKFSSLADDEDVVKRPIEIWEMHQYIFFGLIFLIALVACFHERTPSIFLFGLIPLCAFIFSIILQQVFIQIMEGKNNGE